MKAIIDWLRSQRSEDTIKARGEVYLEVYKDGECIEKSCDSNLVVLLGRTNLAKLLGGDTAGKKVTSFKAGTSGTVPSAGDTSITSPFSKAITSVTYPADGQVQFNFSIETSEGNGTAIQEFGLFNQDGVMFARKTRAVINKDNTIRIAGAWKITF